MITVKNLSYQFNADVHLRYDDWQVKDGDHGMILGASGSGKTTLLHLLSGLLKPTTGSITYDDVEIGTLTGAQLDRFRGKHVGLVFQQPHLISALTVKENVRLATFLGRKYQQSDQIDELLDSLGLADLRNRKVFEISQGQAQRVAIARALINRPKVVFGDEPTASLDDVSCDKVIQLLMNQAEHFGATLIIATHDQRVKSHFSNLLQL